MKILLVTSLMALLGGCVVHSPGSTAPTDTLPQRAAFDLNCPQSEIVLTPIDDFSHGASGCGQRVTYVWQWLQSEGRGQWLMNGGMTVVPATATAVPNPAMPAATATNDASTSTTNPTAASGGTKP